MRAHRSAQMATPGAIAHVARTKPNRNPEPDPPDHDQRQKRMFSWVITALRGPLITFRGPTCLVDSWAAVLCCCYVVCRLSLSAAVVRLQLSRRWLGLQGCQGELGDATMRSSQSAN